ncbi:MAG: L,D-transpeptidase [Synergistaceae bacterium]|nr:L,D-transpeptidase [Synergistaceae bacterium]
MIISLGGAIYFKADVKNEEKNGAFSSERQVGVRNEEVGSVKTVKLIEPDTIQETFPPIQQNVQVAKVQEQKKIIIPLKNNEAKNVKKRLPDVILPSEENPEIDRIIPVNKNNNKGDKYRILINKSSHTLSLLKGDKLIKNYPVATGKNTGDKQRVGDNRTPTGNFKIISIENASSWTHDFRDGKGKIAGAYGPWFLRLDAKGWRGIGIHGTHDPNSRGTNATEGCIRLSNEDIAELKENYAYRNMPVEIREN